MSMVYQWHHASKQEKFKFSNFLSFTFTVLLICCFGGYFLPVFSAQLIGFFLICVRFTGQVHQQRKNQFSDISICKKSVPDFSELKWESTEIRTNREYAETYLLLLIGNKLYELSSSDSVRWSTPTSLFRPFLFQIFVDFDLLLQFIYSNTNEISESHW